MPYFKNGNARHYLQTRLECDRLPIVRELSGVIATVVHVKMQIYDISLGIAHLHSISIVHGDLKAVNA